MKIKYHHTMDTFESEKSFIQKVYPTVNNEDLCEFRIPANVKGNMQMADVMLRFLIKIPQTSEAMLVPENLLGAKQFSSVEIRVNGDAVTRRSCANEYFLGAYFQYMTNFSSDYACTSCSTFGIFDTAQATTTRLTSDTPMYKQLKSGRKGVNQDFVYEIVMPIESSIFSSNQTLPTNTPIDISFERLPAKYSTVVEKTVADEKILPQYLTLEDAYLLIPFTYDINMQEMEKNAISRPIKVSLISCFVTCFDLQISSYNNVTVNKTLC